jgi:predicted RNA-binding protein with RPS1 domain
MVLDGIVTNVTAFGAFIDVGVHQDGLCHVSELANRFVKDPAEVVKVSDRVRWRVLSVDRDRKQDRALHQAGVGAGQRRSKPRGAPAPASTLGRSATREWKPPASPFKRHPLQALIISTTGLAKVYGARTLFEDVSLQLNRGSRYGLVGANWQWQETPSSASWRGRGDLGGVGAHRQRTAAWGCSARTASSTTPS